MTCTYTIKINKSVTLILPQINDDLGSHHVDVYYLANAATKKRNRTHR